MASNNKERDSKPGPEPERLKIKRKDWRKAIREALEKERPKDGWPDAEDDDTTP